MRKKDVRSIGQSGHKTAARTTRPTSIPTYLRLAHRVHHARIIYPIMSRITHKQKRVNVSARGQTCEQKLVDKRKDDLEERARKREQENTSRKTRAEKTWNHSHKTL